MIVDRLHTVQSSAPATKHLFIRLYRGSATRAPGQSTRVIFKSRVSSSHVELKQSGLTQHFSACRKMQRNHAKAEVGPPCTHQGGSTKEIKREFRPLTRKGVRHASGGAQKLKAGGVGLIPIRDSCVSVSPCVRMHDGMHGMYEFAQLVPCFFGCCSSPRMSRG
jgi:hypothetical protein